MQDAQKTIERWEPGDSANTEALAEFKRRISICVEPDPEAELLALLSNRFHVADPIGHVKRWLGELFRGAESEFGFAQALRHIWNDLQTFTAEQVLHSSPGYLWTAADKPPDEVIMGGVLTGQRPTVRHLREGYFANRPSVYEQITDTIEQWIYRSSSLSQLGSKLPFFWIEGRSGTGKSVALLHVLAAVYEKGHSPIIWLADKFEALPQAIRWCRSLLQEKQTVIIALDDPYTPANEEQTEDILDATEFELLPLREGSDSTGALLIVCCGPTDQRLSFQEHFAEHVEVEFAEVPQETHEELNQLWAWFCKRRDKVGGIPYAEDMDILLVQLFFEWQANERLTEFATRFRKRIWGMDARRNGVLEQLLSRMLALNRLYVGYPPAAGREMARVPEVEKSLRRLLDEEHHLTIENDAAIFGLRLAHPHLANAIYDGWFGSPDDEPLRRRHLQNAILDGIRYGDSPKERAGPLWGVARLGSSHTDKNLQQRMPRVTLVVLLSDVYRELSQYFNGAYPTWLLPVWVEIQIKFPEVSLNPSPVQASLSRLAQTDARETGLRLLCHKLLQHLGNLSPDDKTFVIESLGAFLGDHPSWYEWPSVTIDYCRRTRRPDLTEQICSWVEQHLAHPLTGLLLESAMQSFGGGALFATANMWLQKAPPLSDRWLDVWRVLRTTFTDQNAVLETGRQWIRSVGYSVGWWSYVWEDVFGASPDDELFSFGLKWLDKVGMSHGSWTFIWQDLWKFRAGNDELIHIGRLWLRETAPNHASWPYVWVDFCKIRSLDEELISDACNWLTLSEGSHPLWEEVYSEIRSNKTARTLLIEWLDAVAPSHLRWGEVWSYLHNSYPDDAGLLARGLRWLNETQASSNSWYEVFVAIQKVRPDDISLLKTARIRIEHINYTQKNWPRAWQVIFKAFPNDLGLVSLAQQWLNRANPNRAAWRQVWELLYKAFPEDTQVRDLACHWLERANPNHILWGRVWLLLYETSPGDVALLDRLNRWFDKVNMKHGSWGYLWAALYRARKPDDAFENLGRSFLREYGASIGSWFSVWNCLFQMNPPDADFVSIGFARLKIDSEGIANKSRWWGELFECLWQIQMKRSELIEFSMDWLRDHADKETRNWIYVWNKLWGENKNVKSLQELGFWRLRESANCVEWTDVFTSLWNSNCERDTLKNLANWWIASKCEKKDTSAVSSLLQTDS